MQNKSMSIMDSVRILPIFYTDFRTKRAKFHENDLIIVKYAKWNWEYYIIVLKKQLYGKWMHYVSQGISVSGQIVTCKLQFHYMWKN